VPNGGAEDDRISSVTEIGPTELNVPASVSVMEPDTVPDAGRLPSKATETLKAAEPDPEAGVTLSQG
jgi:hypothetical protein